MSQPNDLGRSLVSLEQEATLVAVIELSQSSWLIAGTVPGIERQPLKKIVPDEAALLRLCTAGATRQSVKVAPSPAGTCMGLLVSSVFRCRQLSLPSFSSFFVRLESRFSVPACIQEVSRAEQRSTLP
jgi:hypothetical protein